MLIARMYGWLWLLLAAVAGVFYLSDSLSFAATMILGFSASVLTGAGLLVIYPAMLTERVSGWRQAAIGTNRETSAAAVKLQRAG